MFLHAAMAAPLQQNFKSPKNKKTVLILTPLNAKYV